MAFKRPPPLVLRNDVYQSNPLMQARKEFNTMGMRIFLLGLRGLNPHFSEKDKWYDNEFPELFIPTSQLVELFGGNTKYLHDLKAECKKLFDTIVELNKADGGFILMHLFERLEYVPREGLHLQFDKLMRPYLLDLFESKGYTKLDAEQIFFLTSTYAVRLVELMLQYQNLPEMKMRQKIVREIALDDLKFMLNVPVQAYGNRFDNFRKKVLEQPIKEINAKTLYQMNYKIKKVGVRVGSIEFQMDISAVPVTDERLMRSEAAIKKLLSLGFGRTAAQEIYDKCGGTDDCFNRIARAEKILKRQNNRGTSPVENDLGFLRKAILENWEPSALPKLSATSPATKPTKREIINSKRQKKKAAFQQTEKPPKAEITPEQAQMLQDYFTGGSDGKRFAETMLKRVGWTLDEFLKEYDLRSV